jgi:hypothetical protein
MLLSSVVAYCCWWRWFPAPTEVVCALASSRVLLVCDMPPSPHSPPPPLPPARPPQKLVSLKAEKLEKKRRKRKARALKRKLEEAATQQQREEECQRAAGSIQKVHRGNTARQACTKKKVQVLQVCFFQFWNSYFLPFWNSFSRGSPAFLSPGQVCQ